MNHRSVYFPILLLCASATASADSFESPISIAEKLESLPGFSGKAKFSVSMPQMTDDVVYNVSLLQSTSPDDPLGCDSYIIEWLPADDANQNKGFAAYYLGNHFRFNGHRLQEYHLESDSIPFRPEILGSKSQGVHRTAQFYVMLPQAIASELRRMESDTAYRVTFHPDTTVGGRKVIAIDAVLDQNGATAAEAEYVFDPVSAMPLRIILENNPGSISEQTVMMEYTRTDITSGDEISEPTLIDRFPDAFGQYRESTFSIDNLPGQHLPAFAIPTTTGERYSRRTTDPLRTPTIVALLDAEGGFTKESIDALRKAAALMPYQPDIIWAFTDNVPDRIESVITRPEPGEHLLMSARPLARDCGASSFPAFVIVGKDGIVKNVIVGFNKDLTSDVIQKMAVMQP